MHTPCWRPNGLHLDEAPGIGRSGCFLGGLHGLLHSDGCRLGRGARGRMCDARLSNGHSDRRHKDLSNVWVDRDESIEHAQESTQTHLHVVPAPSWHSTCHSHLGGEGHHVSNKALCERMDESSHSGVLLTRHGLPMEP